MKETNIELRDEEAIRLVRSTPKPEPSKKPHAKQGLQGRKVLFLVLGLALFGFLYLVMFSSVRDSSNLPVIETKTNQPDAKPTTDTKPEKKPEPKPEPKPDKKPEEKPEKKPEPKPEVKPEPKPDNKPDTKQETKPDSDTKTSKPLKDNEDIIRPDIDDRQYLDYVLPNGLRVLAISDPDATTSGASLSVQVGYWSDPIQVPGLAHFLEHSLFLGNINQGMDEFENFVTDVGGKVDSYTRCEETNFHFQIPESEFEKAFKMFYDMIAFPEFKKAKINTEARFDIDEYKVHVMDPKNRLQLVLNQISNQDSPYVKLPVSNFFKIVAEEKVDVAEELQKFYETYYSPKLMSLVLIHNKPFEDLQALVEEHFAKLRANNDATKPSFEYSPKPFEENHGKKFVQLSGSGKDPILNILFPIKMTSYDKTIEALEYLYILLGETGEGSLGLILEEKDWIISLEAKPQTRSSSYEIASLEMVLTKEGLDNLDEIVKMTFGYIDFIKEKGIKKDLFEQYSKISKYRFTYDQYEAGEGLNDVFEEVTDIASNMNNYKIKYALSGDRVLSNFNEEEIADVISQFNTENIVITVSDIKFKYKPPKADEKQSSRILADSDDDSDDESKVLEIKTLDQIISGSVIKYSQRDIPAGFLKKLKKVTYKNFPETFKIPKKNEYLTETFNVIEPETVKAEEEKIVTQIIKDNVRISAWHVFEGSFYVPITTCYLRFNSELFRDKVEAAAAFGIWAYHIKQSLRQELYDIQQAGHSVTFSDREIKIEAFSATFPKILDIVVKSFEKFKPKSLEETEFEEAQSEFASKKDLSIQQIPDLITRETTEKLLLGTYFSSSEIEEAASELELSEFRDLVEDLKKTLFIETLIYGNVLRTDAFDYANKIKTMFGTSTPKVLTPLKAKDIRNRNILYRPELSTSKLYELTSNFYPIGDADPYRTTMIKFIAQLLSTEFMKYIKQDKQIGRIVKIQDEIIGKTLGLRAFVASTSNDTNVLDRGIEGFWFQAEDSLRKMTESVFTEKAKSFIESLEYSKKSYRLKGEELFDHVRKGDYIFSLREKMKGEIPNIKRGPLLNFFSRVVGDSKLSVQLYTSSKKKSEDVVKGTEQYIEKDPELVKNVKEFNVLINEKTKK